MNKLIEDSKKEYEKIIEKGQIEEASRIRNLIVKIFGSKYLDCFDIQSVAGQVVAKVKDSNIVLSRPGRYEECFFMRNLNITNGFSTNPITDLKSFYQNYSALTQSDKK